MSVVNCKVANIRPEYKNLRNWCEDPNNVYVGRAGVVFIDNKRYPTHSSEFCNIFKVGRDGDRMAVIKRYDRYIRARLKQEPRLLNKLNLLKGKNLGCWCAPEACHANVLLKLIDEYFNNSTTSLEHVLDEII